MVKSYMKSKKKTRFFDLIIRNDNEKKQYDNYIRYNVAKWRG